MDLTSFVNAFFGPELTTTDLLVYAVCCILAVGIGVFLAQRQAQKFSGQGAGANHLHAPANGEHPAVTCFDYGDMRFLHLGSPAVQGSMQLSKPFEIHLDYQQRMMAWLLFADLNQLAHLHVMQMGLGAASLTKFCHRHLGTHTTAIELNPQVIEVCQQSFKLPVQADKLQVLRGDAADVARDPLWHDTIDVLQIDLYDAQDTCPVLDTPAFYTDCKKMLKPNGCMVVNVFGRASNLAQSLTHMGASFGNNALWCFKPTTAGNAIVLAFCTPPSLDPPALASQAAQIENRWSLPATSWLKVLAPWR